MEEQKINSAEAITFLRNKKFPVNACWEELARDLVVPKDTRDGVRDFNRVDYTEALEICLDWWIRNDDTCDSLYMWEKLEAKADAIMLRHRLKVDQFSAEIFNLDKAFRLMKEAKVDMSNWEQYAENLCVPISEIIRAKKENPTDSKIAFYECCKYWFDKTEGEKSWQSFIDSARLERPSAKRLKRVLRRGSSSCNEDSVPPESPEIIENHFTTMCSQIADPYSYAIDMYEEGLLTRGECEECISHLIPSVEGFPNVRLITLLNAVFQSAGRSVNHDKDAVSYFIKMLMDDKIQCAELLHQHYTEMQHQYEKEILTDTSSQISEHELEVDVSNYKISDKFQRLMECTFKDTVCRVVEIIVKPSSRKQSVVSKEELKEFLISNSHQNDKPDIQRLESVDKMEKYLITQALHTKRTIQLEAIATHFKLKKASRELAKFIKEKKKLSKKTKLKDFAKLWKGEDWVKTKDSQIVFKVSWNDEATIQKFEEFLNESFGKFAPYVTVRGVKQSIITVICTIPKWLSGAFTRMVKDLNSHLENKGVIEVTLNGDILFPTVPAKIRRRKFRVQGSSEEEVFHEEGKLSVIELHGGYTQPISESDARNYRLQTEIYQKDQLIAKQRRNEIELTKEIEQLKKENDELKADIIKLKKLNPIGIDVPEASEDSNKIYCPPVKLRMKSFSSYLEKRSSWFSSSFYTHRNGYKMCIRVVASGQEEGEGKYLSVYAHLMKGDYDDSLPWPFVGSVQIHLLNQIDDRQHFPETFNFDAEGMNPQVNSRVTAGKITDGGIASDIGQGQSQFIKHVALEYSNVNDTEYLKNDSIIIQVTNVTVHSTNIAITRLPWEMDKPLKTDVITMADFSKYRKTGGEWKSKTFESHSKGYKFRLIVFANGRYKRKGKSVSVYVHLCRGEHDDKLSFPFTGEVCVRLLNSIEDESHAEKVVPFSEEIDPEGSTRMRPTSQYNTYGPGYDNFLEHDQLDFNPNTNTQYLDNDDSLNFTIPWIKTE